MIGLDRRRVLTCLAGAVLTGPARQAVAAPCPPARVLFVCEAGTVNSPIAREQIERSAKARGVTLVAQARGVHPEDHLTPALEAQLKQDGIDARAEPIRALTPADIARADIVIAFNDAAQAPGMEHARNWTMPSWIADYPAAKAQLARQTDALLVEIAARGCPRS